MLEEGGYASLARLQSSYQALVDTRVVMARNTWFSILFGIVGIILLSMLINKPLPNSASPEPAPAPNVTVDCITQYEADNTTCALSTDCYQGFLRTDAASCAYFARPTSVANCSSACYSAGPTACNGVGQCVGPSSSCYGRCEINADCEFADKFELNEALVYNAAVPSGWDYSGWSESIGCFYGKCILTILELFAGSSTNPIYTDPEGLTYNFTLLAGHNDCSDYVMPDFLLRYRECLTFSRELLDYSMIQNYFEFGSGTYGNETFPFQLSVCLISFSCADVYQATSAEMSSAGAGAGSLSPSAIPYKSPSEWGIRGPSDSHPAGIRDPVMRNAFYARLYDVVQTAAPQYISVVLEAARIS
jgi:hypothetical protein